jgi:preprotein translocase subunit SecE
MARAIRSSATGQPRLPALPTAERGNYFKEVWEELKKVVWPARDELSRMTGIVIATVILFSAIIGVADYVLGIAVKQLYAAPGTRTVQQQQQAPPQPSQPTTPGRSPLPTPLPLKR